MLELIKTLIFFKFTTKTLKDGALPSKSMPLWADWRNGANIALMKEKECESPKDHC